jgi:hypothetical protein
MTRSVRHPDASNGLGTLVVLAIGLQLMLSGAGLAAHACSDSLDRTGIRRLSDSVAQALRDMSERAVRASAGVERAAEWGDTPRRVSLGADRGPVVRARLSPWLLSIPPPSLG